MSGPAFVVLPISANGAQAPDQETAEIASAIQQSLHERTHPEEYKEPEHNGPLKQIIAHQDSLYKYISWEDPIRTLGSYIGALSILFGAHHLPLTQMALKAGMTTLGVVSVAEFASRSLGPNSLSARLRPKEYKNVPEATLNATLKDIHDLIQYAVIQAQRIVFGQDLDKTFATFLSCTALYWLTKIVPPLWLAVMGLTSLYIAPLVASPRGRAVAHNAGVRAQELTNAAAGNSKRLAQDGKANVVDLSSKARQTTLDAEGCIRNVAESGKQTVADMSARAKGTASDISGVAGENVRKVPQTGTSAINKAAGTVSSTLGDAKQRISSSLSTNIDGNSDGNRSGSGGAGNEASQLFSNVAGTATAPGDVLDRASSAANKAWQLSSTASETAKQVAPRGHAAKQPTSDHLESVVSSLPGQSGAEKAGSVADTVSKYAVAGDMAATHGIQDRPRGAALPAGV